MNNNDNIFYIEYLKNNFWEKIKSSQFSNDNKNNNDLADKVKKDLIEIFEKSNQNFYCPDIKY